MTIEQLLKKRGYSDQEIADLGPMLQNSKFRKDLEEELTTMESEVIAKSNDLDKYDKWFTDEITPEHEKLVKERNDAVAEAAAAKARFEAYQKLGMKKQAGDKAEDEPVVPAKKTDDLDPSKFVTADTFNKAYESTGKAMANAIDIVSDHMQLFPGQHLNMTQLMEEARTARKPVREFWESKYKVAEKRAQNAQKAEEEKAEKYRQEGYKKAALEFGSNPNTRVMVPSANPFVIRKKADAGKQPWERTESELSRARIEKAIEKAASRGEVAN